MSPFEKNTHILGSRGEDIAEKYIHSQGMETVVRNYRTSIGEIDIIALDGRELVFIEVKTVSDPRYIEPFEQVNAGKRKKIAQVAEVFLSEQETDPVVRFTSCRFDVIGVTVYRGRETVEHIRDAFSV